MLRYSIDELRKYKSLDNHLKKMILDYIERNKEDFRLIEEPLSLSRIESFEFKRNVKFSKEYKWFLQNIGIYANKKGYMTFPFDGNNSYQHVFIENRVLEDGTLVEKDETDYYYCLSTAWDMYVYVLGTRPFDYGKVYTIDASRFDEEKYCTSKEELNEIIEDRFKISESICNSYLEFFKGVVLRI